MLRYVTCFVLLAFAVWFFKTAMALFQTVHRITRAAIPVPDIATADASDAVVDQPADHDYRFTLAERNWSLH